MSSVTSCRVKVRDLFSMKDWSQATNAFITMQKTICINFIKFET